MVAERRSDSAVDPNKDPLDLFVDGEWVRARGTSLGADNGAGMAAALAVVEESGAKRGPLELLFTASEEVGMVGASGLDASLLNGRRMINLDSEEDDKFCIGCAGSEDTYLTLPLSFEKAKSGDLALEVQVSGLRGGHSGVDIHRNRANAIKLLAATLQPLVRDLGCAIGRFRAPGRRNVIPRESGATILLPPGKKGEAEQRVADMQRRFALEFAGEEKELSVGLGPAAEKPATQLARPAADRLPLRHPGHSQRYLRHAPGDDRVSCDVEQPGPGGG